jgi:bacteriocin-like protein
MRELSINELDQVSGGRGVLDMMGDLSMEKQMRLQMYMQPFTQTMAMISNLMHKVGQTSGAIVHNMK